jgi:hypothetical protein
MKKTAFATFIAGGVVSAALTSVVTANAPAAPALSQTVDRPVIVIMKNHVTDDAAARDQAPLIGQLHQTQARTVKSFHMVNAFATKVSETELEMLRAHPAVERVVPDVLIRRAPRAAAASSTSTAIPSPPLNDIPGACLPDGRVLLEPEALQVTHTASNDPLAKTARSLGFTGAGVKVAYIADGVDPKNVNFIRPDGTSAFFDYQDFTGDGPGAPTSGGEAFIDSNAVAGQGIHVYDLNGYSAQGFSAPCNIRIEGMAPGARLLGMNVFGEFEYTTESNFLQAIEYAVTVDHVDVLNESFGGNYYPDITSQDVTKEFNDYAVRAGVTVTVSSGDAGVTSTIGSPATDPAVIAVGASTTFRAYAQYNLGGARYFATAGWINDNISSLSSGGYEITGATIDLVAPGDLGWASCDASALFADCTNEAGNPSVIESSGGTSMSAPLTAGAAALVIEAYRKSHGGASPSPALVKQILTSSATDLGVPATEQGAGIVNTYQAVLLAQSINPGAAWASTSKGGIQALAFSQNQLNGVAAPGTTMTWPVTVTNTGSSSRALAVAGRTFGPNENVQSGTVTLQDGVSPTFANIANLPNNFAVINFKVPSGADRLNASLAYPGNPANGLNARVRLTLIDPKGRLAAYSLPQGQGNYGRVDVREPVAGIWTGIIFCDEASIDGTNGIIPWQVSTQRFVPFGSVSPSEFTLAPGASRTIEVRATTPSSPGDASGSIVVTASGDDYDRVLGEEHNSIAVTLRSLVDLDHGGNFSGVLTGGNGRDCCLSTGQVQYYEFNVGPGHHDITANVSLTNDAGDNVGAYLVNPDGVAVGFGQNSVNGTNGLSLTANTHDPVPGTWTLIVDFADPVVGNEISQPYTGNVQLDRAKVWAPGLPDSAWTKLPAGTSVVVPVSITNTGRAPQQYFIDARLNTNASLLIPLQFPPNPAPPYGCGTNGFPLPLGSTCGNYPEWLVPTQTSSVHAAAIANVPVEFDFSPAPGDPDIFGAPTGPYTASGSYTPSGGTVEPGYWSSFPSEIGPYPVGGAPAGLVNMSMTVVTKPFDPAVTTTQGDFWLASTGGPAALDNFAPLTINPGQTSVINVTITPTGPSGTVVSGLLYVDTYLGAVPPYLVTSGDEVAAIPYTYTIE